MPELAAGIHMVLGILGVRKVRKNLTREEKKLRRLNVACIAVWGMVLVAVLVRWALGI